MINENDWHETNYFSIASWKQFRYRLKMLFRRFTQNMTFYDSGWRSGNCDMRKYTTRYQSTNKTKPTLSGNSESSKKIRSRFVQLFLVAFELITYIEHGNMHMAFLIWWSQVSSVVDLGFWISVRNGQNYCSSFQQNLRFATPLCVVNTWNVMYFHKMSSW